MGNATITSQFSNEIAKYDITIGVLIGIGITFGSYWLTEFLKNRGFKNNVKQLVKIELQYYRTFLEDILKQGRNHPTDKNLICIAYGSDMEGKMKEMLPDMYGKRHNPTNYPQLKVETKAMIFNEKNLLDVERTYYQIMTFNYASGLAIEGIGYHVYVKSEVEKLIDRITKTEEKI